MLTLSISFLSSVSFYDPYQYVGIGRQTFALQTHIPAKSSLSTTRKPMDQMRPLRLMRTPVPLQENEFRLRWPLTTICTPSWKRTNLGSRREKD
jgi:hypothetical protein